VPANPRLKDIASKSLHFLRYLLCTPASSLTPQRNHSAHLIMPSSHLSRRVKSVLAVTTALAAASLLFASLNKDYRPFLRTPANDEQEHRQLLQLNSFNDPKSIQTRTPSPTDILDQARSGFMHNTQWCRPPEEDAFPAPPIDYNQCENPQLIHMDINGGMTSYLNKILKVAMWAARDNSCFYINEGLGVLNEADGGKHFSHSKLGYRLVDGQDTYMIPFLTRYFGQMGLEKSRFEEMLASGTYDVITPSPSDINHHDFGGKASLTTNDPKKRFEIMSIPQLGYNNVERLSLKKHFLRRMFRINADVRDRACHRLASQGLDDEYMALSVRRGDKVTETSILDTVDPYIRLAEEGINSHFDGKVPTMFVATDDCSVMQEFRDARPEWTFVSECDNASEANGFVYKEMKLWSEEQTDAHFNKFIAEMIGMASARYWIGVATTNVSYWVYFMRSLEATDDSFIWADPPRVPGLPW